MGQAQGLTSTFGGQALQVCCMLVKSRKDSHPTAG